MSGNSFNAIYVVIFSGYLVEEFIAERGVDKIRLKDRVRVYRQHIEQSKH